MLRRAASLRKVSMSVCWQALRRTGTLACPVMLKRNRTGQTSVSVQPRRRMNVLRSMFRAFAILAAVLPLGKGTACNTGGASVAIPNPSVDAPLAPAKGQQTAVLAGGCFWGIQAVFEHLKGVIRATSGYSGGSADTAQYERVSTGRTGHAESVQVTYDPSLITYGQLLKVFFSAAHDPTQLNQQGPDVVTP